MSADASHHTRGNGQTQPAKHDLLRSLDDLALLSSKELRRVFAGARVPSSLAALDGDLTGRMLAARGLRQGRVFRALAMIAKSSRFPWAGKTFTSDVAGSAAGGTAQTTNAERGKGHNRVRLVGTRHAVPFTTRFGTSTVDGRPCVVLDYDFPLHDELREVSPGLFLGPACLRRTVVVWFGLQRS